MYAMLEATVYKFAERISGLTDQDLATEWSWGILCIRRYPLRPIPHL